MQQCKHFKKRDAILTCLRSSKEHPSADQLYGMLKPVYPGISLGTIYRNLTLFKQQGLITSLGTVGGVERFDADTAPHVHFICSSCGAVEDLPGMSVPRELTQAASRESGGEISGCQLTFTGTCQCCRNYQFTNLEESS